MGLFSFLGKSKQETASGESEFYSRAEEESQVARGRRRKQGRSTKAANASANSPVDPVLPEKKRARRRLVGAIALVLAMIIGLPMILDSEPKPVSEDIAIQIPSKDKQSALPPVAMSSGASASTSAASTTSSVPVASSLGQQEQVVQMPKPNAGASVPNTTAPVKMPAPAPNAVAPTAPAAATPEKAKPREEAKVQEKLQEKPQDKPSDKSSEKPHQPVVDAKSPAKEHTGEKHDDARAEAILEGKDSDGGKSGADKKAGKFVVQVAALASQEKVNELQGKLTEAGFKSYVQKVPTESGERIRVRIGPFSSKDEAESARAKLSKLGLGSKVLPS
jgi:DedD protein